MEAYYNSFLKNLLEKFLYKVFVFKVLLTIEITKASGEKKQQNVEEHSFTS